MGKQKTTAMKRKAVLLEEIALVRVCRIVGRMRIFAVMAKASSDSVPKRDGECTMTPGENKSEPQASECEFLVSTL